MEEAFESYLKALSEAAEQYQGDPVRSRIAAVSAAAQYLRERGVDKALITPLYDVIGHLDDERLGRTGNSNAAKENLDLAIAAAAVTFAMKAGKNRNQASAEIAQRADLDAKKLKQFRKNLLSGLASAAATDSYKQMTTTGEASGLPPDVLVAKAIEHLREKRLASS
ncbi:hypothetical protein [Bradyrhizobium sp. 145]|uniref:hypothetical protein n=1 Tax=Bradyrhizobium sp. 145 TaxID=2782621 RepID=UPI001FFBB2AC|nr:hypothetical protein [Bradyrhizobium sp. 145]MCK1691616.1 hypothetical protein [Bradyrhizobium sp. 145]